MFKLDAARDGHPRLFRCLEVVPLGVALVHRECQVLMYSATRNIQMNTLTLTY